MYLLFVHICYRRTKLQETFARFGDVNDVYIPVNHLTKRQLGFAFVEMVSRESAEIALKELDKSNLDGK